MRRSAATVLAAVLAVAGLAGQPDRADAVDGLDDYCDPDYPPARDYALLGAGTPPNQHIVTGTISSPDAGPWDVAVQDAGGGRTASVQTSDDFSIPVQSGIIAQLVIDGRWAGLINPTAASTITLPAFEPVTVTTLDPSTGAPLEGARVLVLGVEGWLSWGGLGQFMYLGGEDGAALIQGSTDAQGEVVLEGIPADASGLTILACLDGSVDGIYADLSSGQDSFTIPADLDGVPGIIEYGVGEESGDGSGDGNGDGIPDADQPNVASLPSQVGGQEGPYLTLATAEGQFRGVRTSEPPNGPPPGYTLPAGLVGFQLTGIPGGSTHDVTIHLPAGTPMEDLLGYTKYLAATQTWSPLPSERVSIDVPNRTVTITLTDGGTGDRDGSANGVIDDPGGVFAALADPDDTNPQDGITDALQPPGTAQSAFRDVTTDPDTVGRLVDANGLTGRIIDAPDPEDGVLVTVDPGVGGPAELEVCGMTVLISAGSQVVFTCGSLIVAPLAGSIEVVLDDRDIVVTVAAGSSVEIEDTEAGVTLTDVTGSGVSVTIEGRTVAVPEGPGPWTYDPYGPQVTVTFPDPPASGWHTGPVVGTILATDPSGVTSLNCWPAETALGHVTGTGTNEVTATLTVSETGVTEVWCPATDTFENLGSGAAVVRIDPDADPNVYIDKWVVSDPEVPGAFEDETTTTPVTSGSVVDAAGLAVTVTDAPEPDGVRVFVGPGSGEVTLSVCGGLTVVVAADSEIVLTCGSVIVEAIRGSAQVVLDERTIIVHIPAGGRAEIEDTDEGATIVAVSGTGVTATVDGTTTQVTEPTTLTPRTWVITGFAAPVDNDGVLNTGKAGRAVPLKWHLADTSGQPVTTLTEADVTLTVTTYDCSLGETTDALEQTYAGGSGLQNLGNGNYQLNWKTSTAWAKSCKTMTLDLGGVQKHALFRFTK